MVASAVFWLQIAHKNKAKYGNKIIWKTNMNKIQKQTRIKKVASKNEIKYFKTNEYL